MRLNKIKLTNFRCFSDFEVEFDPRLTVLTAINGHGKTSVLDAVKYALSCYIGRFPTLSQIRPEHWNIRSSIDEDGEHREEFCRIGAWGEFESGASLNWNVQVQNRNLPKDVKVPPLADDIKELHAIVDRLAADRFGGGNAALPVIAYYDTQRAVTTKVQRRRGFSSEFEYHEGYKGCLDAGLDFKVMLEWIEYFEKKEHDECKKRQDITYECIESQVIQRALRTLMPELSNLRTEFGPYRLVVDANIDGNKTSCRVDEYLSDGYRIVLMLVIDLISRILKLNPRSFESAEDVLACRGIVLIDEVDLHLHPSWQQRVLPDLLHVFPNIQFIVTTHSPQVVSTIPSRCVRKIDRYQVSPVAINTEGALSGQVLSELASLSVDRMLKEYANGEVDEERP